MSNSTQRSCSLAAALSPAALSPRGGFYTAPHQPKGELEGAESAAGDVPFLIWALQSSPGAALPTSAELELSGHGQLRASPGWRTEGGLVPSSPGQETRSDCSWLQELCILADAVRGVPQTSVGLGARQCKGSER